MGAFIYCITKIDTSDPIVIELMKRGMVEGTPIEIINIAIGGDPIEVRFFGTSLALRKEQFKLFEFGRLAERTKAAGC